MVGERIPEQRRNDRDVFGRDISRGEDDVRRRIAADGEPACGDGVNRSVREPSELSARTRRRLAVSVVQSDNRRFLRIADGVTVLSQDATITVDEHYPVHFDAVEMLEDVRLCSKGRAIEANRFRAYRSNGAGAVACTHDRRERGDVCKRFGMQPTGAVATQHGLTRLQSATLAANNDERHQRAGEMNWGAIWSCIN